MTQQDTARLIGRLARDVAVGHGRPSASPRVALAVACAASFGVAVAIAVVVFGSADDLAASLANPWFYWKLVCMAALATGAFALTRDLARPSYAKPRLLAVGAAFLLLAAGALLDPSGLPLAGLGAASVPNCLAAILLLSLPGVVLILVGLRVAATTTRPAPTGAAAGLLAGALGAAAYAIVCRNDGALFVLVWYGSAIAATAAIGAALGNHLLKW